VGWNHNDLTAATGAPEAITSPCAYMFDAQGTQHVDFGGADGHIHELWWDATGWHWNDLTMASNAPPLSGKSRTNRPTGYIFAAQGTQHVDYIGDDGHIHELWWDATGWHHNDLTDATGAPTAFLGAPTGYVFAAQGTQHVDYIGDDSHIHELFCDSSGWHHIDLTDATGTAGLVGGGFFLCAYAFDDQGTRHVDYIGGAPPVHELWWDTNGWHYNDDLTNGTPAFSADFAPPAGYVFAAQGTQHVDYIGIVDFHVHELWWEPDVLPVVPVAPAGPILP
jgi:hypothetical protein